MKYTKTTFQITPDTKTNREILIAYLATLEFESFDDSTEQLQAFYPIGKTNAEQIQAVLNDVPLEVTFTEEEMPDINWNEEWEKNYFKPLLINDNVLIRAPFHTDFPEAEYEIVIEPNMAFGTGNHETTSLMMRHIMDIDIANKTVLDMGCGTGILSILTSMLGADKITGIDIDHWSYEGTLENAKLNNITNIKSVHGDASALGNETYDLILANIQKNIILQDMEKYVSVLNDEGMIIFSGFYQDDLEDILGKASELFLKKIDIKEDNNWVAVSLRK